MSRQSVPVVARAPSPSEADLGQRERMVEQLTHGRYECLVCVETIRQTDPVWSCLSCFHVFHMNCVRRWARTCRAGGWRVGSLGRGGLSRLSLNSDP